MPANVEQFRWSEAVNTLPSFEGKYFALAKFLSPPTTFNKQQLHQQGIELLDFVSGNAYQVIITKPVNADVLQSAGIKSVIPVPASVKLSQRLIKGNIPAYAVKTKGTVDVLLSYSKAVGTVDVVKALAATNTTVLDEQLKNYNVLVVRIPEDRIADVAALAFINYLQPLPPRDSKLNDEVRANHRANLLHAPLVAGGDSLSGRGVVIGIGVNADLTTHVDLADRVIHHAPFLPETHGVHVAGIAAGAGILDPTYKGMAPQATILAQVFGGVFKNAAQYVVQYGMSITNNSYGAISGECDYSGTYDLYSTVLDQQAFQLPTLLHVFATGNDGPANLQCAGGGYHRVLGGYQSSKNVLTVAWGDKNMKVSPASSWGPVADGRLKPEITATGSEVRSPSANNTYLTDWGSSMASPAVAGGAALLTEKYKQLNGTLPPAGLLKTVLMNGAQDIESPGPDYKSGFGWMNLKRSVEMIKNNRHLSSSVVQGATNQHAITVPGGMAQLKVMLYWHDPAAAVFTNKALVNNLDLELIDPSLNTMLPWVLDSGNVTAPAIRGIDRVNNVEQVTIASPTAGNYIIRVKGTAINMNPQQEYFIVYDFMPATLQITYPSVNEPVLPGEGILINWDAWDNSPNTFTLEYSVDGGTVWQTISSAIPAERRNYEWTVPFVPVSSILLRVTRNGTGMSSASQRVPVMVQPVVTLSSVQCRTYAAFQWVPVNFATAYDVLMKRGTDMVRIASTTATSYVVSGLHPDSTYWFSVAPTADGFTGRRSVAESRQPTDGSCTGTISDNDLMLDSIVSPNTGRKFTSIEIKTSELKIRVRNLDDAPASSFTVQYSINGGAWVSQTVNATIPALGTYEHSFTGINFSDTGTYNIVATVQRATDPVTANDTARRVIRHLPNQPINTYTQNFESAPPFVITDTTIGLPGLPRWDFLPTTTSGRIRSAVTNDFAFNGSKALNMDVSSFLQAGNTNYLVATFNLEGYCCLLENQGISVDFWFKHHGQQPHPDNRVWARVSDTSAWVEVYNLDSAAAQWPGEWKKAGPIYLSRTSAWPSTSSYQIRIGQAGNFGTADNENFGGMTIDSFRLYQNRWDYVLQNIEQPKQKSCGLGANESLTVRVFQSEALPLGTIPIKYRLNGGPVVTEQINAYATTYTFSNKLDLSSPGVHTIDVWVESNQDYYPENDSIIGYKIYNQPMVSTFPYLEDFENGAGAWYSEGHNSSWQLGKPESIKIKKAASGTNAWKTSLRGSYNDNELSYLYSPCFNTSALATPMLSFSMAMDLEQCQQSVCDAAWMEYSLDGVEWHKLGAYGQGTNWYNRQGDNVWDSAAFKRWHVASIQLPKAARVQLRFVLQSDASLIKEGVAIDDIHVFDRQYPIFRAAFTNTATSVVPNLSGQGFVHFTDNDRLIASINPAGNNLGTTEAKAYVHISNNFNVRNINNQYYHHRNITIKPAQPVQADSSIIRFYFTDAETDTLIRATGCATCEKPEDAYELGVTKYDDMNDNNENHTLADNLTGAYSFIPPGRVRTVPYDNGYYAEYKVKDFSEFWLNNGGGNNHHLLPLQLQSFTATRQGNDVLLKWTSTNEVNVDYYEVEVAKGNAAYSAGNFIQLGRVNAINAGNQHYEILDNEAGKSGVRYYRLKMVDKNGGVIYSTIRTVVFSAKEEWMVYPNPLREFMNIVTQAEAGQKIDMQLLNVTGQVLWQSTVADTGMPVKTQLNLSGHKLPGGVYLVKISSGDEVKMVKVIKQ